jgi:hypothetical protein
MDFFPIWFNPIDKPIDTVVLPTPARVGVMAVTSIKLLFLTLSSSIRVSGTLAMWLPIRLKSSQAMPVSEATSLISRIL